jgi:homoserine kinase type II
MSVYTTVSDELIQSLLNHFSMGQLKSVQPIAAGITNSNYFVSTTQVDVVFTIIETLSKTQAAQYLNLMSYLANGRVKVPRPFLNAKDGRAIIMVDGKPACFISRLQGQHALMMDEAKIASAGQALALLHQDAASFDGALPDERSQHWRQSMGDTLLDANVLNAQQTALLSVCLADDLGFDMHHLPRGVIHADYFKDNVLFDGNEVSGVIDFYYACHGAYLYDVAVGMNDFARLANDTICPSLAQIFLAAYQEVRPYTADERVAWPQVLKLAALRFWLSRLHDWHYPAVGDLTFSKNPMTFELLLKHYTQGHYPSLPS